MNVIPNPIQPMRLSEAAALAGAVHRDDDETLVAAVTEDSRRVTPGSVFVATQGQHADGHDFMFDAVTRGAVAVVGSRSDIVDVGGVPYWRVEHPRGFLGVLAHRLVGEPSKSMTVIGITGTNGKSSSVLMTRHVLEAAGYPTAAFGTLGYSIGSETLEARHTTPFGEELASMFAHARAAGMSHVAMEVSSHALEQERVAGIDFNVAAFTNLTQDHLDYHQDMKLYRKAKLKLFERILGPGRFTVVNADDPSAEAFIKASAVPCYTYGSNGDIRAEDVELHVNRTTFRVATPWGAEEVSLRLLGRHNVSNALCVIGVCAGLGVGLEAIAEALFTIGNVPGRFEHVDVGQNFQVIVDYAHTEDGLRNVLQAARAICGGRIICVFGCGGDRDKGKRPKMARVAAELADWTIVTSDNPRTEEPDQIIRDIEVGMAQAGKIRDTHYAAVTDRETAIRDAIGMARAGDLVLIAGKGHEDYQIFGTERFHFDDREVARSVLEGR